LHTSIPVGFFLHATQQYFVFIHQVCSNIR
jgi:hypothetical protein